MLVELGHFSLILAMLTAAAQGIVPLWGAARRDHAAMRFAETAAMVQFATLALAFAIFMHAHIVSDFSVLNVAENSLTTKPLFYKITGVWGSHEGSMLLWVFMLALYGLLVALFGGSLPISLRARALAVQGLLGLGMLGFIVATSNPFTRLLPSPAEGHDQNPLLQDPGIAVHPPFLYFGYVGFSIAYSFAIAGLLEGRVDAAWARWVRPWVLLSWCGLTVGIALGSWWAYYVLGWGGWWYWDPVENASFMPWLLGTALIHSIAVLEKREALVRWTVLLSILTFAMSLIGTFLVRSGVLTSVHAFALDPSRGVFILGLIACVIGAGLAVYAWKGMRLYTGNAVEPVSREGALVLNNLLMSVGMVTVFLGTFYPLFAEIATAAKISVGPQFFDATFVPMMVPAIIAMVIGPLLSWRKGDLPGTLKRLLPAGIVTITVPVIVFFIDPHAEFLALGGVALALWAGAGVLCDLAYRTHLFQTSLGDSWTRFVRLPRSVHSSAIAHFGVGMFVAGIAVSVGWKSERIEVLRPGESVTIAGRTVELIGVKDGTRDNFQFQRAILEATLPSGKKIFLTPERRFYPVAGSSTTNTSIVTNGFSDFYVALGDPDNKGGWTVRLYFNPLVPWIWFGAAVAAFGGMLSFADRRLRIARMALQHRLAGQQAAE